MPVRLFLRSQTRGQVQCRGGILGARRPAVAIVALVLAIIVLVVLIPLLPLVLMMAGPGGAELQVANDALTVPMLGLDGHWALKREFTVPLAHVTSVQMYAASHWTLDGATRNPGTAGPGGLRAGTFSKDGERIFVDMRHPDRALALTLTDEDYQRLGKSSELRGKE
jgi:hypothetical protein